MCGICGFLSKSKINGARIRLDNMMKSIAHRGPDSEGSFVLDDRIAIGHRRLSVLDLNPRADQPMSSDTGNWIAYNGEIYNYEEIAHQLRSPMKTESDTEVLLASLEEKGLDWTLAHCNGMFAFAWLDRASGRIVLARDRMGIKPLYYCLVDDMIVFGSEIKAILESGLVEAKFNELAVDEYLANRYVRAPYTFFQGIRQLEPGHYLCVDDEWKVQDTCYWSLPEQFNMDTEYDERRITEEFEHHVVSAIQRRMISDVPLGTYLSGGVDSSLITAVAAMSHMGKLRTYTIGFEGLNEFQYAEQVANRYQTDHHEILLDSEDYFSMMEEVIRYKDAPLGVPNEIPLAMLSRELKKEITVVLSGEGADELMGGYGRIYRSPYDYQNGDASDGKSFYDYFIEKYEYVPRSLRDRYLNPRPLLCHEFDELVRNEFRGRRNEENVFRFFHQYHVKGLLQRVDTTTMLAGVEARVPFLDHTLIEYAYREVPYSLKLAWKHSDYVMRTKGKRAEQYSEAEDTPKYLLRKIARRYLPDDIIDRKKVGFPVPLDSWIEKLCDDAKHILSDADWLKTNEIDLLIDDCRHGQRSAQMIWMFVNVEIFRRQYFMREWRYDVDEKQRGGGLKQLQFMLITPACWSCAAKEVA